jgi:hypothetical protein
MGGRIIPDRVRYHFLILERFDLQIKLNYLEEFLHMQDRAQQMRDGDGFQARRRGESGDGHTF